MNYLMLLKSTWFGEVSAYTSASGLYPITFANSHALTVKLVPPVNVYLFVDSSKADVTLTAVNAVSNAVTIVAGV